MVGDTCVRSTERIDSNPKRMRAVMRVRSWEGDMMTRRLLRKGALTGTYLFSRLDAGLRVTPVPVEELGLRPCDVGPGKYDAQMLGLVLLHLAFGRPSLMIAHEEAARILGCHKNTVPNCVERLEGCGWVKKHAQYVKWVDGPRDADGAPTRHKQIVNTYTVGDRARYLYEARHARRALQTEAAQRRRVAGSQALGSDRVLNSAKAEKATTRMRASGPAVDNPKPDPLAKLAGELRREAQALVRQRRDERAREWLNYEAAKLRRSTEKAQAEAETERAKERPTAAITTARPTAAPEAVRGEGLPQSRTVANTNASRPSVSVERSKQAPPSRPTHRKASPEERALLRKARLLYMPEPVATADGSIPARVMRYAIALEEDGRTVEREAYLARLYEDMDRKKYDLARAAAWDLRPSD